MASRSTKKPMSPLNPEAAELIARRFRALSDPTRLRILGTSQQNVSKHLSALLAEGFVARRKRGTSALYRIADPGVHELCDGVCAGIESQLAELEAVFSA